MWEYMAMFHLYVAASESPYRRPYGLVFLTWMGTPIHSPPPLFPQLLQRPLGGHLRRCVADEGPAAVSDCASGGAKRPIGCA